MTGFSPWFNRPTWTRMQLMVLSLFFALLSTLYFSCTGASPTDPPLLSGGGGSETETITGRVQVGSGQSLLNIQVTVWPDTLLVDPGIEDLPDPVAVTSCDSKGNYRLDSIPIGKFSLVNPPVAKYRVHFTGPGGLNRVTDLTLRGTPYDTSIRESAGNPRPPSRDTVLPVQTMDMGGTLSGKFDTATSAKFIRYVQVYGLPRYTSCSATGEWKLIGIPAGTHRLRYLSREPFRQAYDTTGIEVKIGSTTTFPTVFSRRGVKLLPVVDATGLHIEGINPNSPVIYDNELCDNSLDMAFILPAIAKGVLNVKGWVVTKDFSSNPDSSLAKQVRDCKEMVEIGRLSGFDARIEPVEGSPSKLAAAASGRLVDITPYPSAGASLILTEAGKATPENPLVILEGGPLSTLASAYLLDPTVVDRVIVLSIFADKVNGSDTLAAYLVAQKFRFIHWGRGYGNPTDTTNTEPARLPTNLLGLFARTKAANNARNFGDLSLPLFLIQPNVFTGITAKNLKAPPLQLQSQAIPVGENGDIWEITKDQNDFNALARAIYDSMVTWKPLPQPIDSLKPASFSSSSNAKVLRDSVTAGHNLQISSGGHAAWQMTASAAKTTRLSLTVRNTKAATLTFSVNGSKTPVLPVTASATWQTVSADISMPAGEFTFQIDASDAQVEIQGLKFQ